MTNPPTPTAALPELPDPDCQGVYTDGFTMAQMEAYAREAIAAAYPKQTPLFYARHKKTLKTWEILRGQPNPETLRTGWIPVYAHPAEQQERRCEYCDGTGDVHGLDGEWRGECTVCKQEGDAAGEKDAAMLAVAPTPPASAEPQGIPVDANGWSGFDWLETEVSAVDCWYRGDPSYEHDAYWMKGRVVKLIEEARIAFSAPSAAPSPASEQDAKDGDQLRLPNKMPRHESDRSEYPSSDSYQEGYAEGWNDCIDAMTAAQGGDKEAA